MKDKLLSILKNDFKLTNLELSKIFNLLDSVEGWESDDDFLMECINSLAFYGFILTDASALTYEQVYEILCKVVADWLS